MNKLQGIPASHGVAKGKVKILRGSKDIGKLKDGEILVTKFTNPLFTPAILKASAIVTDIGGKLCHAAIIARELGIPCVVGTENATKILKDNQEVIVDSKRGVIYYE